MSVSFSIGTEKNKSLRKNVPLDSHLPYRCHVLADPFPLRTQEEVRFSHES